MAAPTAEAWTRLSSWNLFSLLKKKNINLCNLSWILIKFIDIMVCSYIGVRQRLCIWRRKNREERRIRYPHRGNFQLEAAPPSTCRLSTSFAPRMALSVNFPGIRGNSCLKYMGATLLAPKVAPFLWLSMVFRERPWTSKTEKVRSAQGVADFLGFLWTMMWRRWCPSYCIYKYLFLI